MKDEILEIPRALRLMWSEGRTQYDALVRSAPWTEKPVFIIGSGASYWAALAGAYAFESLLKVPAIARTPEVFGAYTLSALPAHSLLVAISASGQCEKTLEAARLAKKRGARVWALTADPTSELGKLVDGIAKLYLHEAPAEGIQSVFCRHAAMLFLVLAAARVLKGPSSLLETQERELEKLPESIEWVEHQFNDAARALAVECSSLSNLWLVGAGHYHPIACQAADQWAELAGVPARGMDIAEFQHLLPILLTADTGVLFLSGSRGALKAEIHQAARTVARTSSQKLFAITDTNDAHLSRRATLSVLLPTLTEPAGALLTLAFLDCVVHHASLNAPARARPASRNHP